MNTIETIRAEIERLKATNPSEYNYQNAEGYVWALDDILSFLDTLEEPVCHYGDVPSYERCVVCSAACSARVEEKSEIPTNLEDAVKEYFHGMWPGMDTPEQCNTDLHFTPPAIMRLVKHFYELDRGSSEKPNNLEGLDDAAEEYLQNVKAHFLRTLEHPTAKDCFKAGAEWMKKQL